MTTPNQPGNPSGEPPWSGQPQSYGPPQNPHIPQNPPQPGYPAQPGFQQPVPYPTDPSYPYPGYPNQGYGPTPGYAPNPGYGVDPQAPFGRDPVTGTPLSDKSAIAAGFLQLFLGFLGIGRFYIGSTTIGAVQLSLGLFAFFFSLFCFVGFPLLFGVMVWAVIDAIMIFTGSVPDNYGRKLR
jgi:TM2 domain-containing membrane protein YozV